MGLTETGGWYLGLGVGTNGSIVTTPDTSLLSSSPGSGFLTLNGYAGRGGATNTSRASSVSRSAGAAGAAGTFLVVPFRRWDGTIENLQTISSGTVAVDTAVPTPAMVANSSPFRRRVLVIAGGRASGIATTFDKPTLTAWSNTSGGATGEAPLHWFNGDAASALAAETFTLPAGWSYVAAAFDLVPALG